MKNKLFVVICFFIVSQPIICQEKRKTDSFLITDEVQISDVPVSYSNYFSEFNLNKKDLLIRYGKEEISTIAFTDSYTITEYPILAKYFVNDKFSVLFGPKVGFLRKNGIMVTEGTSLFSTFGFQYDITEKFSIEGRINHMLTKKDPTVDYSVGNNMIYKLGTRFKF